MYSSILTPIEQKVILHLIGKKLKKIGIPLWVVLIMLITSIIPFVNIAETIVFWTVWLKFCSSPDEGPYYDTWYTYWRFKDKFFSRKI